MYIVQFFSFRTYCVFQDQDSLNEKRSGSTDSLSEIPKVSSREAAALFLCVATTDRGNVDFSRTKDPFLVASSEKLPKREHLDR